MREIEFRGKAKDTGKWVYGDLIHKHEQVFIRSYNKNEMQDILVIPETVGQFTGLYDIDNKEIYEGDIIKYYIGSNDFPIDYNAVVEIAFGQWGFFVPYYKDVKQGTYKERFSHKITNGIGYKFIPLIALGSETIILGNFPKTKNTIKTQYEIIGSIYDEPFKSRRKKSR